MKDFLTDEEMDAQSAPADFISDEEMNQLQPSNADFLAEHTPQISQGLTQPVGQLEAAVRSFGQATGRGHMDKAVAGARSLIEGGDYDDLLAQERDVNKAAASQWPTTSILSTIGGSIAGGPKSLLGAGIQGAVSGVGYGQSEDLGGMAQDAAVGGVLGVAGQQVGDLVGAGISKAKSAISGLGDTIDDFSARKMFEAMRPKPNEMKAVARFSSQEDVGRAIRDQGVSWNPLRTNKGIHKNLEKSATAVNSKIDAIYKQSEAGGLTKADLYNHLKSLSKDLAEDPGKADLANRVSQHATAVKKSSRAVYEPADLRTFRKDISDSTSFMSDVTTQQGNKKAISSLRDLEMDQLGDAAGANKKLFKEYSSTAFGRDIASGAADRSAKNQVFSMDSGVKTGMALAAGVPNPGFVATGLEVAKRYGKQLTSVSTKGLARALQNTKHADILAKAFERAGNALPATHFLLMQSDPEYRKHFQDED